MIISVTDNLEGKIEPLSYSDAAKVAALIRDLIGCAMVVRSGKNLVIKTIDVKTNYSRKGYGSLLYNRCEKRLKEVGLNEIEVEIPKFPKSEMFYKKHGFVKTGNPTREDLYFAMFKYL
jgi:N-acetylglutamate synthase-like GNAT family acetyltransferase